MTTTARAALLPLLLSPIATARDEPARLAEGRFGQALDARAGGFIAPADERFGRRPLTVELWARLLDPEAGAVLVSNEATASGTHWELFVEPGTGDVGVRSPALGPPVVLAAAPLDDGEWHHVATLLGEDRVRIVVDGRVSTDQPVSIRRRPPQLSGLAVGARMEDRRPNAALIDDLRISEGLREVLAAPSSPLVEDDRTLALWDFDESEAAYLARWTPGGETNQRGLPYPHRFAEFEFLEDDSWRDGRWQETDKGPFVTHSIQLPGYQIGPKAMAVFLGEDRSAAALFDLDRCALVAGLTGAGLEIDPMRFGLLRKPTLRGDVRFSVHPARAWRRASDERLRELEPLGRGEVDYRGLRLHGDRVVLQYEVLGGRVEESCTVERLGDVTAIARHLHVEGLSERAVLTLAEIPPHLSPRENEPLFFFIF